MKPNHFYRIVFIMFSCVLFCGCSSGDGSIDDLLNKHTSDLDNNPFNITDVVIGNIDENNNIIDSYGLKIYSSRTQYLQPKLFVEVNNPGNYTIYIKLYMPDGTLSVGNNSPMGYSYSSTITLDKSSSSCLLLGWGASVSGHWGAGSYRFEFYYKDKKIGEKSFSVYN